MHTRYGRSGYVCVFISFFSFASVFHLYLLLQTLRRVKLQAVFSFKSYELKRVLFSSKKQHINTQYIIQTFHACYWVHIIDIWLIIDENAVDKQYLYCKRRMIHIIRISCSTENNSITHRLNQLNITITMRATRKYIIIYT